MPKISKPCGTRPGELFQENVRLKQSISGFQHDDGEANGCKRVGFLTKVKRRLDIICPILILVIVFITCITLLLLYYISAASGWKINGLSSKVELMQNSFTTGKRIDKEIQDCEKNNLKKTFPDVDYSFYGYNILRGYPLAIGHDPGLTHPIFKYDYSEKKQTADCRFSIPKGFILAPDVSCVTSFTSQVIRDAQQMSKALSVSAQVSGGGWGVSFSASSEYQKKSSEMSSRDSIFIYSQANCDYYFAMLDEINPPPLTKSFVRFVKTLKSTEDVFRFFDYFGTHIMKHVTFGARFVYEHKMSKQKLQSARSSSFSIAAQASYSGLLSFSGGLGMSSSQQEAAEQFQSKVETSVISIGAPPPANGDTLTWASKVKESPVPTKYKLLPIEVLFTERYMRGTGLNFRALASLVKKAKTKYCDILLKKGEVDSCKAVESYKEFKGFKLGFTYYRSVHSNFERCVSTCLEESACIAVDYDSESRACSLFDASEDHTVSQNKNWRIALFIDSIKLLDANVTIRNVELKSGVQKREGSGAVLDKQECANNCKRDLENCLAFTISSSPSGMQCRLYKEAVIDDETIQYQQKSVLHIIPKFP